MIWNRPVQLSRVSVNQIGAHLTPKRMFIAQRLAMQRLGSPRAIYIA